MLAHKKKKIAAAPSVDLAKIGAVFTGPPVPLKKGITTDIARRFPKIDDTDLGRAVGRHVNSLAYLRTCIKGAARLDLDGNAAGVVTAEEASYAKSAAIEVGSLEIMTAEREKDYALPSEKGEVKKVEGRPLGRRPSNAV
jgi:sRNA-binding protein